MWQPCGKTAEIAGVTEQPVAATANVTVSLQKEILSNGFGLRNEENKTGFLSYLHYTDIPNLINLLHGY